MTSKCIIGNDLSDMSRRTGGQVHGAKENTNLCCKEKMLLLAFPLLRLNLQSFVLKSALYD